MIAYSDALASLIAASPRCETERLSIDEARRRFLAVDVVASMDLPPFDNAAMDGYAFRGVDAALRAGSSYTVGGMQAAGSCADGYPHADACEIATGARMPRGFDTVVPVERSERVGDRVRLVADERRGQNVRLAGDDIALGRVALAAGRRLDAAAIMLLAALGRDTVDVVRAPRVAVIATGSELHPAGPLPVAGIHDSNGPFLAASFAAWGRG